MTSEPPSTQGTPEQWPPAWARKVGFVVGLGGMVWEAVFDQSAHIIVYGPAFALTGLPLAQGLEQLLTFILGGVGTFIQSFKKGT